MIRGPQRRLARALLFRLFHLGLVLTLLAGALPGPTRVAEGATLVVNSPLDTDDSACTTAVGGCTLREAINAANAAGGLDTITFSIPGGGVQTIAVTSALPGITSPVSIDGTTQCGGGTSPCVELNGAAAGAVNGLVLGGGSSGSTIKGLIVNRFSSQAGLDVSSSDNVITGNYIGTDSAGTTRQPNAIGIRLGFTAANNTIGGTTAAARNVISGNSTNGLQLAGAGVTANVIQGNYIGTTVAGDAAAHNGGAGVLLSGSTQSNRIGGTTSGTGNVISGNTGAGVQIQDAATSGNFVQGNYVGTNAAGTAAVPNQSNGLSVSGAPSSIIGGSSNTTPQGACSGACNLISGNGGT
ncbi:MAG: CSLREA domain-containing protein, partial [Chloroflexi bacterium]|nr:CSLREA domain-containing protein [Chloroflexota bacterium]